MASQIRSRKKQSTPRSRQSIPSPKTSSKKSKLKSVKTSPLLQSPFGDSPLDHFLSPFRPSSTQWVLKYVLVAVAVIVRAAVGLGPYSGYQSEPMRGDFEAQRHWMEITVHLPMSQWYFHDLEWWGLDYPPLTAYHSRLFGKIGSVINSSWFALYTSRKLDDYDLKSYMRTTVILSELAVYVPGVVWFVKWHAKHHRLSPIEQGIALAAILFQPALILIDHGHFQYNSVMLGLALLSMVSLVYGHNLTASFFFVLSLGFKQMALYYAPIIFAYLLGTCVFPRINVLRLASIGTVVILTMILLFGPFVLVGGLPQISQAIRRIFPFARGLWEDKVANLWCAINTFVKLRDVFTLWQLQLVSLVTTFVSIVPPMAIVFLRPKEHLLPWAFSAGAWGFFLFSFQVHEKSVLLPLMPATLLLSSADKTITSVVMWINNVAMFSMWPLLRREGLIQQYAVIVFLWNWMLGNLHWSRLTKETLPVNLFLRLVVIGSYAAMIALHIVEPWIPRALLSRYPDIWVIANITLSFGCFTIFWLWTLYNLYIES